MNSINDYIDTIIAFFAFSMYYRSFFYVLTTLVTVCVYHTKIIGYLLYLLTYFIVLLLCLMS